MNSTHFTGPSSTAPLKNPAGKKAGKSLGASLVGWCLAIALSGLLNMALFGLMPGLIHIIPKDQKELEEIKAIQVVRIKHKEIPPRKKELKKRKPKQKPKQLKTHTLTQVMPQKKLKITPRLPFQLNPKLPVTSTSLTMPAMEHFSMKTPTLKGQYEMGELDRPLIPLAKIPPIYPMRAMRRGIEGWVKIRFLVNAKGRVEHPQIIDSDPEGIFEKSVINCVTQWRFKPGTVEGHPVNTMAETTIRFKLEK